MNPPDSPVPPRPKREAAAGGPPEPTPLKAPGRATQAGLIFEAAVARPVEEREGYVAEACAGDESLRAEVLLLLSAAKGAWSLLTNASTLPDIQAEIARLKPEESGEFIGRYKLREQIGEGGFGTVWVADQEEPVRRRVALKIIKLGMDTKEVIARFEQERQALAMMEHPNIARVLDAGATEWGRPYFVMELVRGIKITEYCDQENLPTEERLKLFIAVCHAVQHAHQKGIIHRDLKPSNILVTLHDGVPVPKVIDFGVAKATHGRLTDLTIYTQFQQMIGTPLYMSPEQAEMSGLDVDTRSDIYSLGVLLYELLTGRTPVAAASIRRLGLDEIRRIIREQEAPRPSTALHTMALADRTTIAHRRGVEPLRLIGLLRGDLDSIVMKALEKDRTHRYETANGLAMDVQRSLTNEPVLARPTSQLYRLGRMARRNKAIFFAGMAVFLAVLIGGTVACWYAVEARRALNAWRATAPTSSAMAQMLEKEQKFDEAIGYIDAAIKVEPQNPDFLVQRADLLQALQRIEQAANGYRRALALRVDQRVQKNLDLCEKLLSDPKNKTVLSVESQRVLLGELLAQNRNSQALPLATALRAGGEKIMEAIKEKQLRTPLDTIPNFDWNRLRLLPDGTFALDLAGTHLVELPKLQGLPISELYLPDTDVSSLVPIAGLPLRILDISRTHIDDLRAAAGMPLVELRAEGSKVADLSPLREMPLRKLDLRATLVTSIQALAKMTLEYLDLCGTSCTEIAALHGQPITQLLLRDTPIYDLDPVKGMPLETLDIATTRVTNIQILAGIPLHTLDLGGLKIDLHPLEKCPSLEILSLPDSDHDVIFLKSLLSNLQKIDAAVPYWDIRTSPGIFWERHEAYFRPRRPIYTALGQLGVTGALQRATLLTDGTLDVDLSGTAINEITPLHDLPISRLDLSWTKVRDLSPLISMPLKWLKLNYCKEVADFSPIGSLKLLEELHLANSNVEDLRAVSTAPLRLLNVENTLVRDLTPLQKTDIEQVWFRSTPITDCTPLLSCPHLNAVELTGGVSNVIRLRELSGLSYIDWWIDANAGRPRRTAKEFWADVGPQMAGGGAVKPPTPSNDDQSIERISMFWEQGRAEEAIAEYRALVQRKPPAGVLEGAKVRFAQAKWAVTWFPSKALPKKNLNAWRALADGADAVSAQMPWLDFRYRFSGLRGLDLGPELNRKAPGPQDFGMIAKASLILPAGLWRFALRTDDGGRLIINGKTVIERWQHQDETAAFATWRQDTATPLNVVVEYFQEDGYARSTLMLEPLEDRVRIPAGPLGDRVRNALLAMKARDEIKALTITEDGRVELDFTGAPIEDINPLQSLPISKLILTGTSVKDISALHGTQTLKDLRLASTQISDLSPLEGLPLEQLTCNGCMRLSDIGPLKKCLALTRLRLDFTGIYDLSPLQALDSLESLSVPQAAFNIRILQGHRSLRFLGWEGDWDGSHARPKLTFAEFWRRYEAQPDVMEWRAKLAKAGWRGFEIILHDDSTYEIWAAGCGITDLSPLAGAPISSLFLKNNPITSLAPLNGMPLRVLCVSGVGVSDLAPLRGTSLESLCIHNTSVTDLDPLVGMPLRGLNADGNPQLKDLTPLAKIVTLERVVLPSEEADPTPLRKLPKLSQLDDHFAQSVKSASKFWAEYDEKKRK